jgi:large subunit ribosomal protein L13
LKTVSVKNSDVKRDWFLVDATDKTLGRLSTEIARRLTGKHKPSYTPHVDTGDYIVVINADKITVTGNKLEDKMYYRHTGYIGNLKSENLKTKLSRDPESVLYDAIKGMLPKTKLGGEMIKKLKVVSGQSHNHAAQQPVNLEL